MLSMLGMVLGLGSLACWVMVLIKQFQDAGPLHGIIGIVTCGIWTYIWGWMNSGRLLLRNLMLAWTACIVLSFLLSGMQIMAALSGMSS